MEPAVNHQPVEANVSKVPVMGICEWGGYHGYLGRQIPEDRVTAIDETIDGHLDAGFDHIWMMGVWRVGECVRQRAIEHGRLHGPYDTALPGWSEGDVDGSPFAIAAYEPDPRLGGTQRPIYTERGFGTVAGGNDTRSF